MPPSRGAKSGSTDVSLYLGHSFPAAWDKILRPWFGKVALESLRAAKPVAVITPSRGHADFLRRKLLGHGVSLLGVKFLTPPQLREFLLRNSPLKLPLREHLQLLLAVAAEEFAAGKIDNRSPELLMARSVARDPDNFLRAFDQLRVAGADLEKMEQPVLHEIGARFEKAVHACGFTLGHEADRLLSKKDGTPEFADLLVFGFDGAHWPLWPLLHASVLRSRRATVLLTDPRDEARDIDEAWIGTWEEHFGSAEPVAAQANEATPFTDLTQPLESSAAVSARKKNPLGHVRFLMGRDTSEQARAVATLAVSFLKEPECETIGILFPGPGALARLVAQALETLGIPHNDSIAHSMRGTFDDEEWRAWLELQERPQLGLLLRFLKHSPTAVALFGDMPWRAIENELRRACGDILINDVEVLAEYCSRRTDRKFPELARGLRAVRLLPVRATLSEFLKTTLSIFREIKWRERAEELQRLSGDWSIALAEAFSREHFLRWLTELFAESALCRDPNGDHPYARVQLLRYDQAENQSWSHLILAGLNEGAWPKRDDESPFLPDEQIAALNAQMRALNKRATREGRFGAGQTTVREGTALCLGSRERRDIALRQLFNAIESASTQVAIAAQLYSTAPREQAINPSEFFARLYFNARGVALSQIEIERIHAQTRDWLARADLFKPAAAEDVDLNQTAIAYRARRESNTEFGEYEFAFRKDSPPAKKISLSATDTAKLFTTPALVWMKIFLGVEGEEGDAISWNLATGQWVHRWLAAVGDEARDKRFVPRPSAEEIARRVANAAENFREEMMSILQERQRPLPDWWLSGWRNARYLAGRFAEELGGVGDWPQLATEWILDSPQTIQIDDVHELRVRGRIDLLLARGERPAQDELWIVDYKTGVATPLKSGKTALRKQLVAGNGIQICIYALAMQSRGWRNVGASILARETALDRPQLNLADITAQRDIWKEIAGMENTGSFGMLGELRSEFTFTGDYPLAMLAIDKDLLREKWQRAHPAFATAPP